MKTIYQASWYPGFRISGKVYDDLVEAGATPDEVLRVCKECPHLYGTGIVTSPVTRIEEDSTGTLRARTLSGSQYRLVWGSASAPAPREYPAAR